MNKSRLAHAAAVALLVALGVGGIVFRTGERQPRPGGRPAAKPGRGAPAAAVRGFDQALGGATTLAVQSGTADPRRQQTTRVRLLRVPGAKYEVWRVEERLALTPAGEPGAVVGAVAMVGDHIVVRLQPGASRGDLEAVNARHGASIRRQVGRQPVYLVALPDATPDTVPAAIAAYARAAAVVAVAEPDYWVQAAGLPSDQRFPEQWALHNTGQARGTAGADIAAPDAWDIATGSHTVLVGVLDTGVDYTHPDLAANIWTNPGEIAGNGTDDDGNGYVDDIHGYDFYNNDGDPRDDDGHGTHCAGTIGASGNNGRGVTGVNWNVSVVALKFLNADGLGLTSDAVEALNYATQLGIRVTSNSWGGGAYSATLEAAIQAAAAAGALFVAAAGNHGADTDAAPYYPAGYQVGNVLAVAATDRDDRLASFSNYGATSVALAAPGVDILSTVRNAGYESASGTSMAAPFVSGVAALLWAAAPGLGHLAVRDRLLNGVDRAVPLLGKTATAGRLNAAHALDAAWTPPAVAPALVDLHLSDTAGGNGDGYVNPGETIALRPEIVNLGQALATTVTLEVVAHSPRLTVLDPQPVPLPDLAPLVTAGVIVPIRLAVAAEAADLEELAVSVLVRHARGATSLPAGLLVIKLVAQTHADVPFLPAALAADPGRNEFYVVDGTNHRVLTIGADTCRTERVAGLEDAAVSGGSYSLTVSLTADRLFVARTATRKIQVLSLPELRLVGAFVLPFAPASLVHGVNERLYVSSTDAPGPLRQLDATTGAVCREFLHPGSAGLYPNALLRRDAAGTRVFAGETGRSIAGTPSVVHEWEVAGAVPGYVGGQPFVCLYLNDFAVDEACRQLYTLCRDLDAVQVTETDTHRYGILWPLGAPAGAAVGQRAADPFIYGGSGGAAGGVVRRCRRADGLDLGAYPVDPAGGAYALRPQALAVAPDGRVLWASECDTGSTSLYRLNLIGSSSLTVTGLPVAQAACTPAGVAPGQPVDCDGRASLYCGTGHTLTNYAWTFGDAGTATGARVSHSYAAPGTYTVALTVTSSDGQSATAVQQVRVSHAPTAANSTLTTPEDTAAATVLAATDSDGDPLAYRVVEPPRHGTVELAGATATYAPAANYFGADRFTWQADDGALASPLATVTIAVTPVNDAPVAVDDGAATTTNTPVLVANVMANDADPDGEVLHLVTAPLGAIAPAHGAVVAHGDGTFTYTPAAGFAGLDQFSYTIADPHGATATALVHLAVSYGHLPGDWPTMGRNAAHTAYVPGRIAGVAFVPDWNATLTGEALHQAAVAGGRVFVTNAGIFGTPTVWARDTASGADLWQCTFATALGFSPPTWADGNVYVLRSHDRSDSQAWSLAGATGISNWSSSFTVRLDQQYAPVVADGTVYFAAGLNGGLQGVAQTTGARRFWVELPAGERWSPAYGAGRLCSWVSGTFTEHDPAYGTARWSLALPWTGTRFLDRVCVVASGRAYATGYLNALYAIDLQAQAVAWSVAGAFAASPALANGVVYAIRGTRVDAYTAATGVFVQSYSAGTGLDWQPIVTDDAVIAASTARTYVFDLASGAKLQELPYGGRLSLADDRLFIAGKDGVLRVYRLGNTAGNTAPVAADSTANVTPGTPQRLTLRATDAEADALAYRVVSFPAHGALQQAGLGPALVYTPDAGYLGSDSLTFRAADALLESNLATVTVTVAPNHPPALVSAAWADPNPVTLPAGTTAHVVASDPDGDALTYAWTKVSGAGTASFAAPGAADSGVTFSAAGTYGLRVTVTDGRGGSVTSDVTATVIGNVDPRADLNHDGVVNALDLQIVIANFGQTVGSPGCDARADANGDGVVNALDLQIVIANFGQTVP